MALVYMDEIKKSNEILLKIFQRIDEDERGTIPKEMLKKTLNETCLLTPKEIHGVLRGIHEP